MTAPLPKIAIIGGGIGGLTAAIALRKTGHEATVYERAPAFDEVGAGISMTPNAVRGLTSLGLGNWLEEVSDEPVEQQLNHWETGDLLQTIDRRETRAKYGTAYYQLHRADLLNVLTQTVGQDSCKMGKELSNIASHAGRVELDFADGAHVTADVVIAADGLRSTVRDQLFETKEPQFGGHVAYRALIPAAELDSRASEALNINHLGPGRNIVSYPVRKGELVNVVALAKADGWVEEGWAVRAEKADLRAKYVDFAPYVQHLIEAMPEEELFCWGLFVREPLKTWRVGRTVLLGDAAHAMLPYLGQGAASSIEDAIVLGRAFAECADVDEALDCYVATRIERAAMMQRESNLGGERLQSVDPEIFRTQRFDEDYLEMFTYDPVSVPLTRE